MRTRRNRKQMEIARELGGYRLYAATFEAKAKRGEIPMKRWEQLRDRIAELEAMEKAAAAARA